MKNEKLTKIKYLRIFFDGVGLKTKSEKMMFILFVFHCLRVVLLDMRSISLPNDNLMAMLTSNFLFFLIQPK